MKWAAGIVAVTLYLVWPYYTLMELSQAIRAGDAPAINERVDWDQVRASVKAQLQAHVVSLSKTTEARRLDKENPGLAAFGNTFVLTYANAMMDKFLTPQGITDLLRGARDAASAVTARSAKLDAKPAADENREPSLWRRTKFAFFVSPIHFRADLLASEPVAPSAPDTTVTVMLTFKGTGWQVTDVRLPTVDLLPRVTQAPR